MEIVKLGRSAVSRAKELFELMADVFDEPAEELSDAYVSGLLERPDFWVIAAIDQGEVVVGGLTAHTLPMTRKAVAEVFLYDIAVREDRQRQGIGRRLIARLRELAADQGIQDVFVAADADDDGALEFYRGVGGIEAPVVHFSFGRAAALRGGS